MEGCEQTYLYSFMGGTAWIGLASVKHNPMRLGLRGGLKNGVHVNCSGASSLTRGTGYVSKWVGG